jgi:hypothetical protein
MKYLILTQNSVEYASQISTELWNLRYPQSVRQGDEVTTMFCGWVVKPDQSAVAMAFPDEDLNVHEAANMQPLIDLITTGLPSEMSEEVATHLNNLDLIEGRKIENVLPPIYANNLKTVEQMSGWFNEQE